MIEKSGKKISYLASMFDVANRFQDTTNERAIFLGGVRCGMELVLAGLKIMPTIEELKKINEKNKWHLKASTFTLFTLYEEWKRKTEMFYMENPKTRATLDALMPVADKEFNKVDMKKISELMTMIEKKNE